MMEQVMEVRESLLERIKAIRKEDDSITICPEQNIKQEEKLSELRMKVMSILLQLVETEAASVDNLKEIGTSLPVLELIEALQPQSVNFDLVKTGSLSEEDKLDNAK